MQLLDSFANTKILVLGDVMLDRYWWGSVGRISPEAPVPVVKLESTSLAAGGAANVAVNIAGLGAQAILVGVVGNDEEAKHLRSLVSRSGVDVEHLITCSERPTTVKTRVIAHGQQVARIDQEMDEPLSGTAEESLTAVACELIDKVDAVIISDYAKGVLTGDLLSAFIQASRSAQKIILVDPKGKDYRKYRHATMITPNQKEAADASSLVENHPELVASSGTSLLRDLEVDAVLITQGELGMTLFRNGQNPQHFPALARSVYDVTGAGDTVIATLATSLGAGSDFETATHLANVAAGIVVEQVGTTSIVLDELRRAVGVAREGTATH